MTSKATADPDTQIPRGGIWERQLLFGGARLSDIPEGEPFVLRGLALVGNVPMNDGTEVPKTLLKISRLEGGEAGEQQEYGTLSGPIAAMAGEATSDDFPVVAYWSEVSTSRGQSDAVVLTAVRAWDGA